MNSIDPLQLQRLVDGELNLEQIQTMLKEAESTPEHWREMATSFIEDRLFAQSISDSQSVSDSQSTAPAVNIEPSNLKVTEANTPLPPSKSPSRLAESAATKPADIRFSVAKWLLLAACMLVALGIGYSLNPNSSQPGPIAESVEPNSSADPTSNALVSTDLPAGLSADSQMTPAVYKPKYHLEVPESRGILSRENVGPISPVPLYSVQNARQLREFQKRQFTSNRLPAELVKQMSDAGFYVKQDIEFISGNVDKDKKFYVPVRTTRFMPRQ